MANNDVHITWLDNAISFIESANSERSTIIAKRLGAKSTATSDPDVFNLRLNENFPLSLTLCFLYFPDIELPVQDILTHLQQDEIAFQVTIVISLDSEQQNALGTSKK